MVCRVLIGTGLMLFVAASAASAADPNAVYETQCAKCHGTTGNSDTPIGKAMKAPPLAGNAKLKSASEADVAALVKANAKHPAGVKGLSDDDLKAAATHAKGLAAK
jgi:mono/diheme cytochrome c family protein